jgi:hypothetical protein
MALEYTGVPPAPRGMNLAGPSVFIDEAYCRWMQDILVDRPGQIRMRGPLDYWTGSNIAALSSNEQILGMTETTIGDVNGNPQWRGAIFTAVNTATDGSEPSSNAKMYVFKYSSGSYQKVDSGFTLPFKLKTVYDSTNKRWINNTIIDAKPALGGGVWIGVIDDVTNTSDSGVASLFYWRGAGKADTTKSGASWDTSGASANIITHSASVASDVEPGMFAFNTSDYNYLGTVVNVSSGTVTLEKNIIASSYDETASAQTVIYTSVRGFVHQYGRGFASSDASGTSLTTGRLGSDAEGLFKAANITIGGGSESNHKVYVYRNSDAQFIGKITYEGTVTNTQVTISSSSTRKNDILEDEAYFVFRNDTTMYQEASGASRKYPINLNYRRPDQRPAKLSLSSSSKYASPAPGIFNSTYAGRQWFASFNTTINEYDKFINRVVFSSPDNGENINLCPNASDSIIIPGQENIRGIAGSVSGLLVFTESKTYIIRGTDRSNFALEELHPDGCLSSPSIVQVGGGVIWAGKQGIYYFDGVSVRNFTPEALGIYYTDGIKNFNASKDRVYALIYNNYLVINFTNWFSNYTLKRWEWSSHDNTNDSEIIINTGDSCSLNPTSITFNIYLPTGSIGTLSNFTPRGFWSTVGAMGMNNATNQVAPPVGNKGIITDLKTIFTENIDNQTVDGSGSTKFYSNATSYSVAGKRLNGPDFYIETKQYNWGEPTLRKWWRKLMFNLSINKGIVMVEFIDINDNSLVDSVTGSNPPEYNSVDETGFFLVPTTAYSWQYIEDQNNNWTSIQTQAKDWLSYFAGVIKRYSSWIGIRQNSLGFRAYSLRNYNPDGAGERIPEIIDINDWVWGLKALRKGRN